MSNLDLDTEVNMREEESDMLAPVVNKMPVIRQLVLVCLILAGAFAVGAVPFWFNKDVKTDNYVDNQSDIPVVDIDKDEEINFANVTVGAQSALVFDVRNNKILYEKNADKVLPLASITKLMTALVAKEIIDDNSRVTIGEEAIDQSGDGGVSLGEKFSYQNLSNLTLVSSSNDGAYALAAAAGLALSQSDPAAAFVKAMNVRAEELGLNSMSFRNPTGLDITETESGAYGNAKDVSKLMSYIVENYPEVLEETSKSSDVVYNEAGQRHQVENTNEVADMIVNLLASKTGYTTLAGGNLVVEFDAALDRPVIVVVLGSTYQGRFSDVLRLVEATRNQLKTEE